MLLRYVEIPVHIPHGNNTNNVNNTLASSNLELLVMPYQANQPADPQLQDDNFASIFLFSINKFLAGNTKNIACSLQRMAVFIKQRLLDNRTSNNISQIMEFGSVAWKLINAIYKSRWNNLIVNSKDKNFQQCISFQFNKNRTTILKTTKEKKTNKDKQADISRIFPYIPPRPSKSVFVKSKYYKKT